MEKIAATTSAGTALKTKWKVRSGGKGSDFRFYDISGGSSSSNVASLSRHGRRVNPLIKLYYANEAPVQPETVASFKAISYLRKTPPRRLAFKHSGGDSRLCTSATVTLYLLVLLSNDNRPGTEQNTSEGCAFPVSIAFSLLSDGFMSATSGQHAFPAENYAFRRLGIN